MTTFDTRNNHAYYDTDTHKVVPKDAVVLDIGSAVADVVVGVLRAAAYDDLADQIEAQTKPARIPEPGLWGVVWATVETHGIGRGRFVRDGAELSGHYWECLDWSGTYGWDHLVDPVLIRPGIEDES